jgi:hypothetical protein
VRLINIGGPGMDDEIIVSTTRAELLNLSREEYIEEAGHFLSIIKEGDTLTIDNTDAKRGARALKDIKKIVYSLD